MPKPADHPDVRVVPSSLSRRDFGRLVAAGSFAAMLPAAASFGQDAAPASRPAADPGPASLQGAGFYRFPLGGTTVTMVSDGGFVMQPSQIFPKVAKEELAETARLAHVSGDAYPGQVNVVVIERGDARVLVDTGCGRSFGPTAGFLLPNLRRAGLDPASITHVALTHAHPDHVGGLLDADGRLTFANAKVLANRAEHAYWTNDPQMPAGFPMPAMFQTAVKAAQAAFEGVRSRLELFEPDQTLAGLLKAIDAPGHTPGHVAFELSGGGGGGASLVLLGDAIHLMPLQLRHPEWHIAFDSDGDRAEASRRMLLARASKAAALTTAAHAPFPPAGYIDAEGSAYRWTPVPWQW